jgi:hypothetical protein
VDLSPTSDPATSGWTFAPSDRSTDEQPPSHHRRGDVEEWIFKHNELVERVKAQLGSRTPAMKSTLAWFRMQEVNTDNPAEDRVLWKKLADEMESFTAARQVRTASLQQPQLW